MSVIVKLTMLPRFLTKRKIALLLLFFFLISTLLAKPILAYSTSTVRGGYLFNFESAVFKTEEMNLQSFVNETFKAIGGSIWTSFWGCFSCTKEEREKYPGFIVTVGSLIASIYASPPASGTQYLAYLGNKLGIARPVYAQGERGIGFQAMENVLPIWTAFRNISYVFFVLILVFIGFAIMFRLKISPQAVITIQSALPKIVLALILITFSYAIVGFMIDLMYVLVFLITSVFKNIPLVGSWSIGSILDNPTFDAIRRSIAAGYAGLIIESLVVFGILFILVPLIGLAFFLLVGPPGWIFLIILTIVTVIVLVRLALTLLKAYVMIIIGLIFAPFQILLGTIPGSNAIGSWFKNMLANIAVLPATLIMCFLSSYLILKGIFTFFGEVSETLLGLILGIIPGSQGQYDPGLIAKLSELAGPPVGFWNWLTIFLLPLAGLMILWMAPKVSDMIKSYLAGKPFEYGFGIGEAVGPFATKVGVPFVAQKYMYEGDWGRFDWARRGLLRTGEAARVLQKPMTTPE